MARCPNCARETLRTKDWVCQWCGYPLLSGFYRRIDKTFKDIQEERDLARQAPETEESRPRPEPPLPTRPDLELEVRRRTEATPRPERVPEPAPRPKPEPELKKEPEPGPPPASMQPTPPAALPEPIPESPPPPLPEPAPETPEAPPPRLEEIVDGAEITVDHLDALYRANRTAAHARLTGKVLSVKGLIERVVIRDHLDVRYVLLKGARKTNAWNVRGSFEREHNSEMGRLTEGQAVTVRGRYDGSSKNILFKDCVLVG